MKALAKRIVVAILGWQLRRLRRRHSFKIVAVAGSIGKTTTKYAIATVLRKRFRVLFQEGNYNDLVTVPLVFFDIAEASLMNPLTWLKAFLANEQKIRRSYPYEVVVVELGTDGPGQMKQFGKYLRADIGVLTSIVPEHMEFFDGLDAVAAEELEIINLSKVVLANGEQCGNYLLTAGFQGQTYGTLSADYVLKPDADRTNELIFINRTETIARVSVVGLTRPRQYAMAAAAAIGDMFGMTADQIANGLAEVKAVPGRMQELNGIKGSHIFDDTYNASPEAAIAALDTLYQYQAPQRIAILGSMNELGEYAERAHRQVGAYCDPSKLDAVVTIGAEANKFLAAEALKRGCTVHTFDSPLQAGNHVKRVIQPHAAVLAKGSQNKVFAEEAVKMLLANPADKDLLVRQNDYWLNLKSKQFHEV